MEVERHLLMPSLFESRLRLGLNKRNSVQIPSTYLEVFEASY